MIVKNDEIILNMKIDFLLNFIDFYFTQMFHDVCVQIFDKNFQINNFFFFNS